MQEKRLPPRERGLKPTHFIEVWENADDKVVYYGCDQEKKCTALEAYIDPIRFLDLFTDEQTIAIFKIYPHVRPVQPAA